MKSIQQHLTYRLLAAVLLLAGAAGIFIYGYARARLSAEFDHSLVARAQAITALMLREPRGKLEFNMADANATALADSRRAGYYQIWQPDGRLFARSPSLGTADLPRLDPQGGRATFENLTLPGGRPGRLVCVRFTPRLDEDDEPGAKGAAEVKPPAPVLILSLAQSRHGIDETLRVLASSLALAALALGLVTTVAVTLTVRSGLRPLHRLGQQADAIAAASLHHRFSDAYLPRELEPIQRRLNGLLARLDEAFARERRFTADVAHELRTPIAELKTLAEVALKWPEPGAAEQTYRDTLDVANHMEALVTTLLAIARCEARVAPIQVRPLDLCELAKEAWKRHAAAAAERGLTYKADLPSVAPIESDRVMLQLLIGNLLSNATAYTPVGGHIDLGISRVDDGYELCVRNTCCDLAREDMPRLFEPFWRKDASRTGGVHCGLGLALVRAYAAALGATPGATLEGNVFQIAVSFPPMPDRLPPQSPGEKHESLQLSKLIS